MFQNVNKSLVLISPFLLLGSCGNIQEDYINNNFNDYADEYKIINDSVRFYVNSELEEYKNLYMQEWEIDSLVLFNKEKDKLYTTINNSSGIGKYGTSDAITELIGEKINGKWYFIQGASLVVPRDMYGKDEYHPLTFKELSQIARKEMFGDVLSKSNGKFIVNEYWMNELFYNNGFGRSTWSFPKYKNQYDSVRWFYITDKWKHKLDTHACNLNY